MNRRIISLLLVVTSLMCLLAGCGKEEGPYDKYEREELEVMLDDYLLKTQNLEIQVSKLQQQLQGVQAEKVEKPAISQFGDLDRLTLYIDNGTVKLPADFEYPNSIQSANTSTVNISEHISVKPSSNWVVNLNGTTVELYHPNSGIFGTIKVGSIDKTTKRVLPQELQNHMNEFFSKMPPEEITYNRIYIQENWMGMDAASHTYIDEEDARLRCGMLSFGDECVTYMLAYKGEQDSDKDDLILNLLQSMKIYTKQLRVE